MALEAKRKEGESTSAFLYRFSKKMQQSGILREAKKRRNYKRVESRVKRKAAALYKDQKKKEVEKSRKLGK